MRERHAKRSIALFAGMALLATAVRWQHLDDVGYTHDESFCWKMTTFDFDEIWRRSGLDNHPPLYFYMLKAWSNAWGRSPETLRLLSVLLGVAAVGGAYLFTREMVRDMAPDDNRARQAALLCAALVAFSPHQIDWSQQLRMYSLGAALALVSSWLLLRSLRGEHPRRRFIAGYALAAILLSYTHYFGLLIIAAQFFYALGFVLRRPPSSAFCLLPSAFAPPALAWLPWLPTFLAHRRQTIDVFWTKPFTWQDPARVCFQMFAPYFRDEPPAPIVAWLVLAALVTATLAMLWRGRSGARLVGLAIVVTVAAALASSLRDRNVFVARYFIFAQAMFLCGVAALVAAISPHSSKSPFALRKDVLSRSERRQYCLRRAAAALLLCGSAVLCVKHAERREGFTQRPGMMAAMAYLADVADSNELIITPNPAVQINASANAVQAERVYVLSDDASSFPFYQGKAVMRDDEYLSTEKVARLGGARLWAVDTPGWPVKMPDPWVDVSEESFPEWLPADSRIIVHCYRRRG